MSERATKHIICNLDENNELAFTEKLVYPELREQVVGDWMIHEVIPDGTNSYATRWSLFGGAIDWITRPHHRLLMRRQVGKRWRDADGRWFGEWEWEYKEIV